MPYRVVKRSGKRPWKIVELYPNGSTHTVGSSTTKEMAQKSIRARYMGEDKK
jgi:hypothetical protein